MEKINYSLVSKQSKSGMLSIQIECRQYHRSVYLDTNIRVFEEDWDYENCRVINSPKSKEINILIRKYIYELEEYEFSFEGEINIHKLKQMWIYRSIPVNFYSIIEKELPNRKIRKSTYNGHLLTFKYLKQYKEKCSITDLTEDFVKGFYNFMKEKTWNNGKKLKDSSINKTMEIFRCYYNLSYRLYGRKVPRYSFRWYKFINDDSSYKALNKEDIRILENYSAKVNSMVVDQFLFLSYTGLRYSDFISLTKDNIKKIEGKLWIEYTSVKTNVFVKLPINSLFNGRAEQIIYKYWDKLFIFFSMGDNSTWNRKITRHSKLSGLGKKITCHMARHTFACRLLEKSVPITTIQKVIGHKKLETTLGYAKMNDETLSIQLAI